MFRVGGERGLTVGQVQRGQQLHAVRGQDAEGLVGEVGRHEPAQGLHCSPGRVRVEVCREPGLTLGLACNQGGGW